MKVSTRLFILAALFLLFCIGGGLWWWDATSAINKEDPATKIFVIDQGESIRSIASNLKSEKLIKDPVGFFLFIKLKGYEESIQAGDFRLSPSMTVPELVEALRHGTLDVWVQFLEGWRNEEYAYILSQEVGIPETEYLKIAREGYMFPDKYLIPKDASASAVVQLFGDTFHTKVTEDIRQGIAAQGLTFEEGIILASLVEREGRSDIDRPMIAGILLNRLKIGMPLQVDATLQYALGYQPENRSWWKKALTNEDKEVDSLYNTYQHIGLPPAPIANPGLGAIQAVAYPTESAFWYYLHDPKGQVHYAATLEEHNANIAAYLN